MSLEGCAGIDKILNATGPLPGVLNKAACSAFWRFCKWSIRKATRRSLVALNVFVNPVNGILDVVDDAALDVVGQLVH